MQPTSPVMHTPSTPSAIAFVSILTAVCLALLWGVAYAGSRAEPSAARRSWLIKTALGLLVWLGITGALSGSGVLAAATLPPPLLLFAVASLVVRVLPVAVRIAAGSTRLRRCTSDQ